MKKAKKPAKAIAPDTPLPGERALPARKEAFCLRIVEGLNATQAAVAAGYSAKTAYSAGSRLLKSEAVMLRLQHLRSAVVDATVVAATEAGVSIHITLMDHLRELAKLRDAAVKAEDFGVAVAAETARGKAAGFHSERMRPEDLEKMNEAELEAIALGKVPLRLVKQA